MRRRHVAIGVIGAVLMAFVIVGSGLPGAAVPLQLAALFVRRLHADRPGLVRLAVAAHAGRAGQHRARHGRGLNVDAGASRSGVPADVA